MDGSATSGCATHCWRSSCALCWSDLRTSADETDLIVMADADNAKESIIINIYDSYYTLSPIKISIRILIIMC